MSTNQTQQKQLFRNQDNLYHSGSTIGATTTISGLVNGMISGAGICVVLPLLGLSAGWFTSIWTSMLVGFVSYYTGSLIVTHLGKGHTVKECLLEHTSHDYNYLRAYCGIIWFNQIIQLIIYFQILCIQIQGLLGYNSTLVGPITALFLLTFIFLARYLHFCEHFLAIGIVSIVTFLFFIIWSMITAPPGPKVVPTTGPSIPLLASLMAGYSIHDFMVQSIIKNPKRQNYHNMVKVTFVVGFFAYIIMIIGGSIGIANRVPLVKNPQVINDYFHHGMWQIMVIEVILSIQVISMFPFTMVLSEIRFFQVCKIEVYKNIDLKQVIYVTFFMLICFLIYAIQIHLQTLINLAGAVVGYIYIILIPILMHIRCAWYDKTCGFTDDDEERNAQIHLNACECENNYRSKWFLYLQTVFLIFILIGGFVLMIMTLTGSV